MAKRDHKATVSFIERIILLVIIFIVPLHFIVTRYFSVGLLWERVNYFHIVNVCFSIIFIAIAILQYFLNKPYLAVVFGCHQLKDRSFHITFRHLNLCARCSGILVGVFIMLFFSGLDINQNYFLLGIIPLAVDGFYQYFSSYKSTNNRRFVTGFLFAPALIVLSSYYYLFMANLTVKFITLIR